MADRICRTHCGIRHLDALTSRDGRAGFQPAAGETALNDGGGAGDGFIRAGQARDRGVDDVPSWRRCHRQPD